ncbi:MAG: D-sedoheptulose 7-phosphate isomerase [Omnitrophica bacterium]|nr:D-sedoheptulose 7-phosphate isomerase [Candidatus Omnitrophota bacterium]
MKDKIKSILSESIALKEKVCRDDSVASIAKLAELVISCFKNGGKLILFGNGGSASDAQHIAAEFVGRFIQERKALPAIALTCNTSILTCLGNDYGFEQIFSRQIEALGKGKDLVIAISTSGKSPNVVAAISKAKKMGLKTAALTAEAGAKLAQMTDVAVCVPSKNTARIQEAHITIGHIICELTERAFFKSDD